MNIKTMLGLATLLAAMSACSDTPAQPSGVDASLAQVGGDGLVPFKGAITFTHQDDGEARQGPSFDPTCSNPPTPGAWLPAFTQHGTAEATHMGKTTLRQNGCIDFTYFSVGGPFLAYGEATLTAANGDAVSYTYDGFVEQFPSLVADVEAIITGGTGRFSGATGAFTASSLGNSTVYPAVYPFDGMISSPGSLR